MGKLDSAKETAKMQFKIFPRYRYGYYHSLVDRYKPQGSYATNPILDQRNGITCKPLYKKQENCQNEWTFDLVNTEIAETVMD